MQRFPSVEPLPPWFPKHWKGISIEKDQALLRPLYRSVRASHSSNPVSGIRKYCFESSFLFCTSARHDRSAMGWSFKTKALEWNCSRGFQLNKFDLGDRSACCCIQCKRKRRYISVFLSVEFWRWCILLNPESYSFLQFSRLVYCYCHRERQREQHRKLIADDYGIHCLELSVHIDYPFKHDRCLRSHATVH